MTNNTQSWINIKYLHLKHSETESPNPCTKKEQMMSLKHASDYHGPSMIINNKNDIDLVVL